MLSGLRLARKVGAPATGLRGIPSHRWIVLPSLEPRLTKQDKYLGLGLRPGLEGSLELSQLSSKVGTFPLGFGPGGACQAFRVYSESQSSPRPRHRVCASAGDLPAGFPCFAG